MFYTLFYLSSGAVFWRENLMLQSTMIIYTTAFLQLCVSGWGKAQNNICLAVQPFVLQNTKY